MIRRFALVAALTAGLTGLVSAPAEAVITVSRAACENGGGHAGTVFCIGGKWNGKVLH